MDLKSILKSLKLNESNISMVLGALVVVVVGVLVINYLRESKVGSPSSEISTAGQEITKHVVAEGESLWSISEKYYSDGYKWVELAKTNNIENAGYIEVGQELTIPDLGTEVTPSSVKTTIGNMESIAGATYEVVKGDSLWEIAVRAYGDGYKWSEIARENKLVNPNLIHSGNILILSR